MDARAGFYTPVKCDENRPSCSRCSKNRQACEYPHKFDLILRNQNDRAEKAVKKKWRQRATRTTFSPSLPNINGIRSTVSQQTVPSSNFSTIPQLVSLRPSLQQLVHSRFIFDFATARNRDTTSGGALDRIPQLMAASPPDSWLYSAISALSFANFGNRLNSQDAKYIGAALYNTALGRFAKTISSCGDGKIKTEEALFGIFLLGIYEAITSTDFDGIYATHQRGAISILEYSWDGGNGRDRFGKSYHASILYMQALMYCLTNIESPPSFLADIELYSKSDPRSELTTLMYNACKLRYKFSQHCTLFRDKDLNEKQWRSYRLLWEVMDLDKALEEWYQRITSCGGQTFSRTCTVNVQNRPQWARELFNLPGAPKEMIIYDTFLTALSTNHYRGTRLLLNLSILEWAHSTAHSSLSDAKTLLYNESIIFSTAALLMELITDLCMSVPFMLQLTAAGGMNDPQSTEELYSLRGMLMLWPLVAAIACLQNKDVQNCDVDFKRGWLQHVFVFLRNSLGLGKAQAFLSKYN
ncbi:hypothetical protein GGI43DRAFT_433003 [Trichoderma evansii]